MRCRSFLVAGLLLISVSSAQAGTAKAPFVDNDVAKLEAELAGAISKADKLQVENLNRARELAKATEETAKLKVSVSKLSTELATALGEKARLAAEQTKLSGEIERLQKILKVKNDALDQAIQAIQKQPLPVQPAGARFNEETLGSILVERKEGFVIVTVPTASEEKADVQFSGAITEKRRATGDQVTYVLAANKLKANL